MKIVEQSVFHEYFIGTKNSRMCTKTEKKKLIKGFIPKEVVYFRIYSLTMLCTTS